MCTLQHAIHETCNYFKDPVQQYIFSVSTRIYLFAQQYSSSISFFYLIAVYTYFQLGVVYTYFSVNSSIYLFFNQEWYILIFSQQQYIFFQIVVYTEFQLVLHTYLFQLVVYTDFSLVVHTYFYLVVHTYFLSQQIVYVLILISSYKYLLSFSISSSIYFLLQNIHNI